jgi:hypothetical protein
MRDVKIILQCVDPACKHDPLTELVVKVPEQGTVSTGDRERIVYCKRNHPNIITAPKSWFDTPLVLGDDDDEFADEPPIMQGRDP